MGTGVVVKKILKIDSDLYSCLVLTVQLQISYIDKSGGIDDDCR